ncbi:MAG: DUF2892 domain-containing protein [Thermoanaerobacteraceae bacterium]|nr:DUF2892 domain-containing protein [Thermoanaerobacteraceae bacterium]
MKKNVGDLDALIRLWTGLYIFGRGISKRSILKTSLGGLVISEALTRRCLLYSIMGISTLDNQSQTMNGKMQGSIIGNITLEQSNEE